MKLSILMGLSALSMVACTSETTTGAKPNAGGGAAAAATTSTSEVALTLKRNP